MKSSARLRRSRVGGGHVEHPAEPSRALAPALSRSPPLRTDCFIAHGTGALDVWRTLRLIVRHTLDDDWYICLQWDSFELVMLMPLTASAPTASGLSCGMQRTTVIHGLC